MLNDYIQAYKQAIKEKNTKEMERIEKDLQKLGMDRLTLRLLTKEV